MSSSLQYCRYPHRCIGELRPVPCVFAAFERQLLVAAGKALYDHQGKAKYSESASSRKFRNRINCVVDAAVF